MNTMGIENKEQGRPPIRTHLWVMENVEKDGNGMTVEYDLVCQVCGERRHIEQPPLDFCPG